MRLLFLLQDIPYPPATGMNSKAFNVLKRLSGAGWECDLLCFARGDYGPRKTELEARLPGVKVLSVHTPPSGMLLALKKTAALFKGLPPSLGEYASPAFSASLESAAAAAKYDAAHYDVINMAQYLPLGPRVPSVLSSNDAISLAYDRMIAQNRSPLRKLYLAVAAALIRRYEREVFTKFDLVHVVSEADAAHLRSVAPGIRTAVIPIAVDGHYLDFIPHPSARPVPRVAIAGNLDIPGIANGLFGFLEKTYAGLKKTAPPFDLVVLGPKASPAQKARLAGYPGLEYVAWVDDYRGFLAGADILLVLDRSGTGIKTRVLEAMALARPVVGTSIAFGGIAAVDGKHCLLRNDPAALAEALASLLHDPYRAAAIGVHARELIAAEYSMQVVGPRWEKLYSDLATVP